MNSETTLNDLTSEITTQPELDNVYIDDKSLTAPRQITQGENIMADMLSDPTLHTEHAAIRHDIGLAEANIRDKVGASACGLEQSIGNARRESERGFADTRYNVATEAGALSKQIGAEACGINQEIGTARREVAAGFGDTRYNIATNAGDIRREIGAEHCRTNDIVRQEGQEGVMATKDARYDVSTRVGDSADRIVDRISEHDIKVSDRFFTVGRDLADLRQGQVTIQKDVELNTLKTQLDAAKNTQYLADKIVSDGEKTRGLINDLKYHDLSRGLVERNTELVECESERRHWRHHADQNQFQGQWAQLQSQIQAFQSQLQETRQGLVNFGTMAGNAGQQSSTSNNVR